MTYQKIVQADFLQLQRLMSDPYKIRTTHNLSLGLDEYFWIILLYWHLVYFILKVLAWDICDMKWGFAKNVIIESQRQFMYGSNFYGSDVSFAYIV